MGSTAPEQTQEVVHLSVVVPTHLRRELEQLAAAEQRTLSGQVRVALGEHVEGHRHGGDSPAEAA